MYSHEERIRAVKLYIKYYKSAASVISELGYPKDSKSLVSWYKEYLEKGDLHENRINYNKYTKEQRDIAVAHYLEHGKCCSRTVRALGYPSRPLLDKWVMEDVPENDRPCKRKHSSVNLSQSQKEEAVIDLCIHKSSAQDIADRYGINKNTLYTWKRQLLDKDSTKAMPKTEKNDIISPDSVNELKEEVKRLQNQADELNQEVYRLRLEKDILEKAAEIIKKDQGVNLETLTNREKATVIDALRNKYSLKELLGVFHMSKSSYCYQESTMSAPDKYAELRGKVHSAFDDSRKTYGYRRIHSALKADNITVSEKVVRSIMKEENLIVYQKKNHKYNSYKGEITPAVENVINRDFHADSPNEKWLTDITEFHIPAGKIYLSPIIDCFDGLPVSWTIGTSPDADLVNAMLDCAIGVLKQDEHPIVHSDRGCHYRWPGWIERMDKAGLTRSMSKKGCSPDNSACEGFFGRLKNEMFYNRSWKGVSIQAFIDILDDYIHWYATKRIKMSLGGLSPIQYRISKGLAS